ncbi:MAG: hypothetical protein IPI46_10540 [Bacteroidetes bacterium]|nr:hypothetical protein [Bacteroidota bacterium]
MSVAKIRPTEEVRNKDNTRSSAPIAMREKESLSNSESDYLLDNKPQEAKKIAAKKGSNVGLSNSKPATNYNSNQLNYSQDKNISNNQVESVSAFDAEASLTDYQQGMQYFNAGNFKRSIRYLEDALPEADATQREDIQYYLAQAYVKTGKNAKADKMFKLLASGSKYKAYAEEQLIKVTK